MARPFSTFVLSALLAVTFLADGASARNRQDTIPPPPIVEASPALAPFQHVRFCLRYPADCKSDPTEINRIELTTETSELLKRVNSDVNAAIRPIVKDYGPELQDGWTIAPSSGDCNDYAVTKRHELLQSGLPAKALRLSVVKTSSGIGHLVLVVMTTKGDLVLDNLTETVRPWQTTDYHWLKIQSANDAKYWFEVKASGPSLSQADQKIRIADRAR
jgi:predicted transglutaminase-like cysteine proteinase